ncbi:PqiC family protein [Rhodobacteraceae bacterium N5(2021)]|uniref:PqiC family protein n=1 Tax=Gymnodinialimonas phycosphaerae TaxID=2841589 RepID=A0A975TTX2_9RHOB|nr:PqiC family protein [Gymnodinialimonas phycosphaerae]MBY4894018.1 PqiC family protein [Gymnodinialimonas phycosphaerae]
MNLARITIALVVCLAGCGGDAARLSVSPAVSEMQTRVSVRSVAVADISLPEYASASEVVRETEGGLIEVVPDLIWADVPEDAMANAVVRHLSQITSVPVARTPWPLSSYPDAELTIRAERMLLGANGQLHLSGQFAIRRDDGAWAERIRSFDIAVPVRGEDLPALADAHGEAWRALSEQIAGQL